MAISLGTAILGAAVIGGGASLLAGKTQADAASEAAALTDKRFQMTRADLAPWRDVGAVALTELADLYGLPIAGRPTTAATPQAGTAAPSRETRQAAATDRFFTSPGYKFRLDEGIKAIERRASSRGRLSSGATGRELVRYGQGLASAEFGSYANRLSSLAGSGQVATTATGQIGAASAANQGNLMVEAGTGRASGIAGFANAFSGGAENLLYMNYLDSLPPGMNGLYRAPREPHLGGL